MEPKDALLSLDAGGRGLVLPQLDVPGFVDSPCKARMDGGGIGRRSREQKEGSERELKLVCKMNKTF